MIKEPQAEQVVPVGYLVPRRPVLAVTVRTPQAARPRELLLGPGITVTSDQPGVLRVRGLTAEQIGAAAWRARLPVFELTTRHASLEEAFMRLTDDSVDFRAGDAAEAAAAR